MKVLLENYVFDKSEKTITLTDIQTASLDRLILVVNATINDVIYNPIDATRGATVEGNVITFVHVTSAMADTDKIMVYYDDPNAEMKVSADINVGDIEIGAVELKDATTDRRLVVNEDGSINSTSADKDANGNLPVTLGTGLNPTDDEVTAKPKGATPVNLSASGQILAAPGQIVGFYVNSTSSGTIRFSDALTAASPYLGAAITPAVGYHAFPANLATGGYATIGATLDVTIFVIAN